MPTKVEHFISALADFLSMWLDVMCFGVFDPSVFCFLFEWYFSNMFVAGVRVLAVVTNCTIQCEYCRPCYFLHVQRAVVVRIKIEKCVGPVFLDSVASW